MPTIYETSDYDKFVFVTGNRPVLASRVKLIAASMKKENLLPVCPIIVAKENGKLRILDGQGRYHAAKLLGLPISYTIASSFAEEMIGEFNSTHTKWTPRNYLNWYADRGNKTYAEIRQFVDSEKMPVAVAISILTGDSGAHSGGRCLDSFRSGNVEITEINHAYRVAAVLNMLRRHGITFATARVLVLAVSKLCKTSVFDEKRLDMKLEYLSSQFVKCAEWTQYVAMIDKIYNYKCTAKQIVSLTAEVRKLG